MPSIVQNIASRVAANSLTTWQNRHKRGLEIQTSVEYVLENRKISFIVSVDVPCGAVMGKTSEVWSLPILANLQNTGTEWFLQVMDPLFGIDRCMLLMTLWRRGHNRNEVVHNKPAPLLESSRSFLCSCLDSLIGIKFNQAADPAKGNGVVSYDQMTTTTHAIIGIGPRLNWSLPPLGWTKLNS